MASLICIKIRPSTPCLILRKQKLDSMEFVQNIGMQTALCPLSDDVVSPMPLRVSVCPGARAPVFQNRAPLSYTSKYLLPVSKRILLKSSTSFSSISLSEYTLELSWSHRWTRSIGYRMHSGWANKTPCAHGGIDTTSHAKCSSLAKKKKKAHAFIPGRYWQGLAGWKCNESVLQSAESSDWFFGAERWQPGGGEGIDRNCHVAKCGLFLNTKRRLWLRMHLDERSDRAWDAVAESTLQEVSWQDAGEDGGQSICAREMYWKHGEMSLYG